MNEKNNTKSIRPKEDKINAVKKHKTKTSVIKKKFKMHHKNTRSKRLVKKTSTQIHEIRKTSRR